MMRKTVHKATAIVLALLGILPVLYAFFFLIQQYQARREMKEKLEKEKLTVITIDKQNFSWYKNLKEIKINDELFDVKDWKEENGKIIVKGLFDKEESRIKRQLIAFTQKKEKNSSAGRLLTKMIVQLTGICPLPQWQMRPVTDIRATFSDNHTFFLTDIVLPVFTPPPQV